jgi:CheY-like chemotaxis protein
MRPQAQLKSLALHIDAAPDVPEKIRADRTRVKQILFNLLNNAVKFSDRGVVVLDLHPGTDEGGNPVLDFVVTDTGIGMDEATLQRLFKRFSQGDESRSRRHGGTGLGLEICRSLARLMGGDVTAKSVPGEGSSFTFRMPLHVVTPAPRPEPMVPALADGTAGGMSALRVLVAEDHPVNRQYMAALLEGMGHKPFFAGNGLEAVQAIREQRFDLVLMDLHMPLLDGVGATLSIRALPDGAAATVPIIALTADAFAQTRERCLMAGMNDFLAKPVSPERLSAMLRRLFGGASAADASAGGTADIQVAEATPPVLDRATLDGALRAMPRDRMAHLLETFFEQGPDMVQRLRVALRDGQALDLRVNAHAVRGAALNFGLSALAQTAQALHEGATHVPAHEIALLIQRFEQQLAASREACEAAGLLEPVTE